MSIVYSCQHDAAERSTLVSSATLNLRMWPWPHLCCVLSEGLSDIVRGCSLTTHAANIVKRLGQLNSHLLSS